MGEYDPATGKETDRIKVTLATRITKERVEHVNLDYLNPEEVKLEEWAGHEDEGVLLVPRAGEMLYRVKEEQPAA
jgi:hypothetical protein